MPTALAVGNKQGARAADALLGLAVGFESENNLDCLLLGSTSCVNKRSTCYSYHWSIAMQQLSRFNNKKHELKEDILPSGSAEGRK